jgi:hypothetical protein
MSKQRGEKNSETSSANQGRRGRSVPDTVLSLVDAYERRANHRADGKGHQDSEIRSFLNDIRQAIGKDKARKANFERSSSARPTLPMDRIAQFIEDNMKKTDTNPESFRAFEDGLHARVMEFERACLAEELKKYDVDADAIEINGVSLRRAVRSAKTYTTGAGDVVVERWLYRDRSDDKSRCVCPMELKAGIIDGLMTDKAAKLSTWVVAQFTPQKAEELFDRVGNMNPSKSTLDRLLKNLSERWEDDREKFQDALCEAIVVPEDTVSIAVSLDGVLIPMESTATVGDAQKPKESTKKQPQIGAVYHEAGCGTVSFCDGKGQMLGAIRMARVPEYKKTTLKTALAKTVKAVLQARPDIEVVKVADGAHDNWKYLDSLDLPPGYQVLDFFHASQHLHEALASVYGANTQKTKSEYEQLRSTMRYHRYGAAKVIRALEELDREHPNNKIVQRELHYFKTNKQRMKYAVIADKGMMIGSGVVEAACKTLVTQRIKLSGMYWSPKGSQAILTPRGWDQSECFDKAWALVAATYGSEVTILANVINLTRPKPNTERISRKMAS